MPDFTSTRRQRYLNDRDLLTFLVDGGLSYNSSRASIGILSRRGNYQEHRTIRLRRLFYNESHFLRFFDAHHSPRRERISGYAKAYGWDHYCTESRPHNALLRGRQTEGLAVLRRPRFWWPKRTSATCYIAFNASSSDLIRGLASASGSSKISKSSKAIYILQNTSGTWLNSISDMI